MTEETAQPTDVSPNEQSTKLIAAPVEKYPIINCHTHIFTGDHVAPFLARTLVMAPFYKLLSFKWIFPLLRKYYKKKDGEAFDGSQNLKARTKFQSAAAFRKKVFLYSLYTIIAMYFTIQSLDILCHWIFSMPDKPNRVMQLIKQLHDFLNRIWVLLDVSGIWWQLLIVFGIFFFYKSGRNMLKAFARLALPILKKIPGKNTLALIERYLTIGRFAFHTEQGSTLGDLEGQYAEGTGFVILPMDMDYMEAGTPTKPYKEQMQELAELKFKKENIYPFVFVDPRRIAAEGTDYFNYEVEDGKVKLLPCFIKDYIEGHTFKKEIKKGKDKGKVKEFIVPRFSGFKIYPALGYYPFDPLLLPLWKYAEQENLPILTHCVRGPMYFRGKKSEDWNYHPIFQELIQKLPDGADDTEKDYTNILLAQTKNDEFSANFTHPMNFLCLLKKEFLVKAVEIAYNEADKKVKAAEIAYNNARSQAEKDKAGKDKNNGEQVKNNLKNIFDFSPKDGDKEATLTKGLDDLKICLGHYGGGDEWFRYFEKDRFNHSAQVIGHPDHGIDFIYKLKHGKPSGERSLGKPEQLWKFTDWYSIISSMMLQHNNVYADISYILHADAEILPLLKQTLQNKKLRSKVLYGTDFFVVRNHKSDKNMLADMMGGLDVEDFDQIARCNPRDFLNLEKESTHKECSPG